MATASQPIRKIGIISGVQDELDALLPEVARTRLPQPGFDAHLIDHQGKQLYLACAGIGKVAAAMAASSLHARFALDLLMVLGTAGDIGGRSEHVFWIAEALQSDYGAQRDDGFVHYTAGTLPIGPAKVRPFPAFGAAGLGLAEARIATGDVFVESGIHAARLRDGLGVDLVDMETAAVAQVAQMIGIPWCAIKATTDGANGDSAASFADNLEAAARAAALAAEDFIAML